MCSDVFFGGRGVFIGGSGGTPITWLYSTWYKYAGIRNRRVIIGYVWDRKTKTKKILAFTFFPFISFSKIYKLWKFVIAKFFNTFWLRPSVIPITSFIFFFLITLRLKRFSFILRDQLVQRRVTSRQASSKKTGSTTSIQESSRTGYSFAMFPWINATWNPKLVPREAWDEDQCTCHSRTRVAWELGKLPRMRCTTATTKALTKRTRKSTQVLDLRSTCVSFGHPLASTCIDLRRLAWTCVDFGRAQIWTQVDASFLLFGQPAQVDTSWSQVICCY